MSSIHMLIGDRYTYTDWPKDDRGVTDQTVMDAMTTWLKRHGIEPMDVVIPGRIVRDPIGRRVEYQACRFAYECRRDSGIRVQLHPHPECPPMTVTVQLEAPPLPWPRELVEYVYRNRPADDRPGFRLNPSRVNDDDLS